MYPWADTCKQEDDRDPDESAFLLSALIMIGDKAAIVTLTSDTAQTLNMPARPPTATGNAIASLTIKLMENTNHAVCCAAKEPKQAQKDTDKHEEFHEDATRLTDKQIAKARYDDRIEGLEYGASQSLHEMTILCNNHGDASSQEQK